MHINKLNLKSLAFTAKKVVVFCAVVFVFSSIGYSQVTVNINSGNPNHPFPQFLEYASGTSLAIQNGVGIPHAEMEQRTRDAYTILTNGMTYNVNRGGVHAPVTVAGVKYIMPHDVASGADVGHCTCVEGDGYNLLAAAYMGDKATFDGYYMWVHDRQFQKTKRFIDCITNSPGYAYSPGISGAGSLGAPTDVLGGGLGGNSAMDGDVDLAMALLVAWKQWGDLATICNDPCTGLPVTYKGEAIKYIKTMVDTLKYAPSLPIAKYISGIIGLDGYHKGGDSWAETTNWASAGALLGLVPGQNGPQSNYVDYAAPSYFRSFYEMLTAESESPWCINQYKRAEASDDWLVGQAHAQGNITWAGTYTVTGTTPAFSSFMASEDNRFSWRTHLNYLWNGAPTNTWNPTTHQYTLGSNTFERDAALRMANFMKAPEAAPYSNACRTHNTLTYGGPPNVKWSYNPDGTGGGAFPLNWAQGTSAPAAVVSGDRNLQAQMFRQCVIEWDQYNDPAQKYLTSRARYFHEWNRLLGMMVLGGNYHDPLDMAPTANMKVYMAVDKTYASTCDQVTYTISYRNYGKTNAAGVKITDALPAGLTYVSSTKPATVAGGNLTFNVGAVPGFVTGGLAATMDSIKVVCKVTSAAVGRLCNQAVISCTNGSGWTSNEYPNNITPIMMRNCVDILSEHPLNISKTASKTTLHPGDTVSYTIVVKNKSVAFLNGGRPGVIVAGGHSGLGAAASTLTLKYRIYHGAEEAYINYQNYRVSYYLNKPGPPTWVVAPTVNEGAAVLPTATQQSITPGATWNHRFLLTFPNQIATITPFLAFYSGQGRYIHEGALTPQRLVADVHAASWAGFDWTKDWSSEPTMTAADGDVYWPIAKDWTDPLLPNQAVLKYHPNNCTNNVTKTITKQLVEEWDGYTWRRIYGDAPISGRELNNVVVTDVLPAGVTFGGYFTGYPTGSLAGGTITWPTIANMKISDSTIYKFWVTVDGVCPKADATYTNVAYANATSECQVSDTAIVTATCNPIIVVPAVTSMKKTADAATYNVGDPITYTIGYKNTHGTVVSGATAAADWTAISGTGKLTVNGAGVIDMNSAFANKGMTYKYSHGKDGIIKGTATFAQYAGPYAVMFRHNGATWSEVRIKVDNANVAVSFFNMPANTQIGATQTITYSALPGAFDFKIQLVGAVANFWLVNSGAAIVGAAPISQSTIPIQTGYAGVRSSDGAVASLSNWYTSLDSGFDQQLSDAIPGEVTFVSASNGGTNIAGTVTYPKIAGPVLANDTITYTWTGTVSACTSGKITNTAFMKMMGITPDPGAQNIVACSGSTPLTVPGTIAISQTICNNVVPAAFTNTVAASGGSGTYAYQWQSSLDSIVWTDVASATAAAYASPALTATTWFKRKVTAGGAAVYTNPVKVTVYAPLTGGIVLASQNICYNTIPLAFTSSTLPSGGAGTYTYQWQSSPDSLVWTNILGATTTVYAAIAPLTAKTYYKRVATSGTCGSVNSTPLTVIVNADLTAGSITAAQTICPAKTPAPLTQLTAATGGTGAYTYQWQSSLDGVSYSNILSATSATYSPPALIDTTYYKRFVTSGTCGTVGSAAVKITVLLKDSAKIIPAGPFCSSDIATTLKLKTGSITGGTWSGGGVTNTSTGAFDPSLLVVGSYKIKYATAGACPIVDSINILISNGVSLSITSTQTAYCLNGSSDTIEVSPTGGVFWTTSGKGITDSLFGYYDPKLAPVGSNRIWYGKSGQCGDTTFIDISVSGADIASIVTGQTFCESEGSVSLALNPFSQSGVWSGTGISNAASGAFNAGLGAGSYLISYTTNGLCPTTDTATVKVAGQLTATILTADTAMCTNASSKQIRLSSNSVAGGVWTSSPAGKIGVTGVFDPLSAGPGVYKIYYAKLGSMLSCSAIDSVVITVSAADKAKITLGQGLFCLSDPIQILKIDALSDVGIWSATGIVSGVAGTFDPSAALIGPNLVTYTTSGACAAVDTMSIYVVNQMVADITQSAVSICEDTSHYQVILTGGTTPQGVWSSVPAGMVNASGDFNPTSAVAGTTYKVFYTLSGATPTCSAKDSISIKVEPREDATITTTIDSLCYNDAAITLQGKNTGGTWVGTGVNAGQFDPSVALLGGVSPFTLTYILPGISGTCPDHHSIQIVVVPFADSSITPLSAQCLSSSPTALVAVTKGGTFSGKGVSGLVDHQTFNPSIAGVGTHFIQYTQAGKCAVTSTISVFVQAAPEAIVVPDVNSGCEPLLIHFGDSSTAPVLHAHWDFGDGTTLDTNALNASVAHLYKKAANNLNVTLSIDFVNGCKDVSVPVLINVLKTPVADFSFDPQPASALDPQITFTDLSGALARTWYFGAKANMDSSISNPQKVIFDTPNGDTIAVTMVARNGACVDTIRKDVYIKGLFSLFIPNAFSPNGDGHNDEFFPDGLNHVCDACANYDFSIFNRWGEQIFSTDQPNVKWNGKRSNTQRDAEIDVYVWKLTYTNSFNGKPGQMMGRVTLVR